MPRRGAARPGREASHQPWKPEEDEQLRQEHARGDSVPAMMAAHRRSHNAIRLRLIKLGLEEA